MIKKLAAISAVGYLGYRLMAKSRHAPAYAEGEPDDGVRNAGPNAARDENSENWSPVDQELDESFPASDPPANY